MEWKILGKLPAQCSTFCAVLVALCFAVPTAYGSDAAATPIAPNLSTVHRQPPLATRPFSHTALGFSAGTMGPGLEVVTTMSWRSNLRVDAHFLGLSADMKQDDVDYNGTLHVGDVRLTYDFYPFGGGFRVSTGLAVFQQMNARAVTGVSGGRTITFNDVDYYSSVKDPLHGAGTIALSRKVAPTVSFGWGNAIPRSRRHFAFPVEIGVAFAGTPNFNLTMVGSACSTPDPNTCASVVSYADFKTNLDAEKRKINRDIEPLRFYPIANFGVTYRF